jgi:hypothetical protein
MPEKMVSRRGGAAGVELAKREPEVTESRAAIGLAADLIIFKVM